MYIWSMNKWELVEFADIYISREINKTNNSTPRYKHKHPLWSDYSFDDDSKAYIYHVNVYSKNVFISAVDRYSGDLDGYLPDGGTRGTIPSTSSASINRCVIIASFYSEADAVALVQDIIDACRSGVKVYSVSDGSRYC